MLAIVVGYHGFDHQQFGLGRHGIADIAQNFEHFGFIPVMHHALERIGLTTRRHRFEERPADHRGALRHACRVENRRRSLGVEQDSPRRRGFPRNGREQPAVSAADVDDGGET